MSADANEALVAKDYVAWHVELRTGATSLVAVREDPYDNITSVAFCEGGFRAVLSHQSLRVFAAEPAPAITLTRRAKKAYASETAQIEGAVQWGDPIATLPPVSKLAVAGSSWMHAVRDGKLLIVQHEDGIGFIAVSGGALRELAKFGAPLHFACEREGEVYLEADFDKPGLRNHSEQYTVTGLAEALAGKANASA